MDMDLIDRGALRKELAYMWYDNMNATAEDVEKRIFDAPTVDAVEVVRCNDCEYYSRSGFCRNGNITSNCDCDLEKEPNGYCDWGERRDGD